MRAEFERRSRRLSSTASTESRASIATCPKGAFYVFANISRTGWKSKPLADALLEQAGVAALSGTAFGHYGEGFLRFSVANSMENLDEALKRIKQWTAGNISETG